MPHTDGVRPFDWVQALMGEPVIADPAALRAAWALLRFAPGRARAATGWSFFCSEETLAEVAQCSPPTIRRGMKALKDARWVEQLRRGGGVRGHASVFALRIPPRTGERRSAGETRSSVSGDPSVRKAIGTRISAQSGAELRSEQGRTPLAGERPVEKYPVEKSSVENSPSIAGRSTALGEGFPNAQNLRRIQREGHDQADYDVVAWARKHIAEHGSTNPNEVLGALMKCIEQNGVDRAEVEFCDPVLRLVHDPSNPGAVVRAPNHP